MGGVFTGSDSGSTGRTGSVTDPWAVPIVVGACPGDEGVSCLLGFGADVGFVDGLVASWTMWLLKFH